MRIARTPRSGRRTRGLIAGLLHARLLAALAAAGIGTALPALAAAAAPGAPAPAADAVNAAASHTPGSTARPRLSIVLMRHGVRSPTKPNGTLDPYSVSPWPTWSVAPGRITAHGHDGLVALGQRYRALLAPGLGIAAGCAGLPRIAVITDSDNRNHASAQALGQGLAPGCGLHYRALPEGQDNPLFGADDDDVPTAQVRLDADARQRIGELQALLLDCHGGDCAHAAPGRKRLLDVDAADRAQADAKALKQAGSLAENLMLEYAEGMPMAQVGWGRLDRAGVARIIALHDIAFAQSKRPLPVAAANGSNLLAHLLATLQAGAGQAPASAPLADPQTRLLFVIGHDTNLANLAGLLDLHWQGHDGADLYPPGGGLVFDLVGQGAQAKLRIRTLSPGLDALRQNRFDGDAIASRGVSLAACHGALECPLEQVVAWLQPRLDARHIAAGLPPMSDWPAQTGR